MYLSSVIVIIGVFVTASSTSSLNLPHSKISEYKGKISCNSKIVITSEKNNTNITKYKYDLWQLSTDDSGCVNIQTNIDKTEIHNSDNTNIIVLDCNGSLINSSSSNDCKYKYFIQVQHFYKLYEYTLKVFCSNNDNTQCDKIMRRLQSSESDDSRVEIGYSKQLIGIHSSSSDSDSAYDKQYEFEDTLYPTKFATTTPTPVPPQHTFCNGPRHTGEYNGVPIQIEVYVEDKSDITFDASTSLFTVAHIEARHNSGLIDQINGDVLTIYDQPGNRNYLFTFTADQPSTTGIQYTFNIGCVTYAPTIPSISVISPTKYPSKYPTKYPTIPSIPPTKYPTKY
eukprot:926588_1